ncbi:MAG: PAS domain S-box protein [Chloroflexota bacterium]
MNQIYTEQQPNEQDGPAYSELIRVTGQALSSVTKWLAVLYTALSISHILTQPVNIALPMSMAAAITAFVLLIFALFLHKTPMPERLTHAASVFICSLALFNSLLHLSISQQPFQNSNLLLLFLASGFFILSTRWLMFYLTTALTAWFVVQQSIDMIPDLRIHWFFALGIAVFLAFLTHNMRKRTILNLYTIRAHNERQKTELQSALQNTRATKSLLETVHANVPSLVIWSVDAEGIYQYSAGSGLALLGRQESEVVGQSIFDVYENTPSITSAVEQALAGQSFVTTIEMKSHQGDNIVFRAWYSPVWHDEDEIIGATGVALDITQLVETDRALRISERNHRQLIDEFQRLIGNAKAPIFGVNRDCIVTEWNHEMEEITGVSRTEALETHFVHRYIAPENQTETYQAIDSAFRGVNVQNFQFMLDTPSSEQHQTDDDDIPTQRTILTGLTAREIQQGQIMSIVGVGQDITEQLAAEKQLQQSYERLEVHVEKRTAELNTTNKKLHHELIERTKAELALRESEEQFKRLIELAPNGMITLDRQGRIILSNSAFEQLVGVDDSQQDQSRAILGEEATIFIAPEERERCEQCFRYIIENSDGQDIRLETILQDQHGTKIPVEVDAGYFVWNTQPAIQIIIRDISERREMEEALEYERALLTQRVAERTADLSAANAELAQASRMKDEFLASMSHELRTPLNAILGLSEALQEKIYGDLTDKQVKTLMSIERSGRHLLSLITDILDISKIEAGKFELSITETSVPAICESSLEFIRQAAQKKDIQLSMVHDPIIHTIRADERRLKQILVNLLSNAVKFTPEGGSIGIEVVGRSAEGAVQICIWDTGIGVAKEDIYRLFQPFVQLDSRLSRQHAGTGLGLALVYRMVELHGGSISVESAIGKGSRFTILLPWQAPETEEPVSEDSSDGILENQGQPETPLKDVDVHVDDENGSEEGDVHKQSTQDISNISYSLPPMSAQIAGFTEGIYNASNQGQYTNRASSNGVSGNGVSGSGVSGSVVSGSGVSGNGVSSENASLSNNRLAVLTKQPALAVASAGQNTPNQAEPKQSALRGHRSRDIINLGFYRTLPQDTTSINNNGITANRKYTAHLKPDGSDAVSEQQTQTGLTAENSPVMAEQHNNEPSSQHITPEKIKSPPTLPPLILIAEDNEANIRTLSTYLSMKGYRLAIARNGTEAVEQAVEIEPDAILMDVQMPEMNGLEAMEHIRDDPSLATIPIIAITALAMPGDKEKCMAAGATGYLSKPVSLRSLSDILETQLL